MYSKLSKVPEHTGSATASFKDLVTFHGRKHYSRYFVENQLWPPLDMVTVDQEQELQKPNCINKCYVLLLLTVPMYTICPKYQTIPYLANPKAAPNAWVAHYCLVPYSPVQWHCYPCHPSHHHYQSIYTYLSPPIRISKEDSSTIVKIISLLL